MSAIILFFTLILVVVVAVGVFAKSMIIAFTSGLATLITLLGAIQPGAMNPENLLAVQCRQLAVAPKLFNSKPMVSGLIARYLNQATPVMKIWHSDDQGTLFQLFNSQENRLTFRNLEKLKDSYNVVLLDLSELNSQLKSINVLGPILLYSSKMQNIDEAMIALNDLRIRSRTAIVFCNDQIPSTHLTFDAPFIVSERNLGPQVSLLNSATPGQPAVEVSYVDLLKKIVRFVTDIDEKKHSATNTPASVLNSASALFPRAGGPPRHLDLEIAFQPRPIEPGRSVNLWDQTVCHFSWGVVCETKLDRDQLQGFVAEAFKKQDGEIKIQKSVGPLEMLIEVSNPSVFLQANRLGITLDVDLHQLNEKAQNPILKKVADSLPQTIQLRNVKVHGNLVYEDSTGEIFYKDPEILEFEILGPAQHFLQKNKASVISALNQVLKPVLEKKPLFDFKKQKAVQGIVGKYLLEKIETKDDKFLILYLKLI